MSMTSEKKRVIVFVFCFIFVFLLSNFVHAGLGITPGKREYEFAPNMGQEISYRVSADEPDGKIEIYVIGELAQYATLDKKEITGSGSFKMKLKLPSVLEKAGKNQLFVGAREKIDGEISAIGTAVAVQAVVNVYVPYPGRYAELTLSGNNANIGEDINFKLSMINRGREELNIIPKIEIYEKEEKKETLFFQPRQLVSGESIELKKSLITRKYNAGEYKAIAIIEQGDAFKAETKFKIGDLFVKINNYTNKIFIDGLQKFNIEIENGWNNKIENVYAVVGVGRFREFKTTPESLEQFGKSVTFGYIDTNNITKGVYSGNITLFYSNKSSSENISIEFVNKLKIGVYIWVILAAAFILLVVSVGLIMARRKKENAKRKK